MKTLVFLCQIVLVLIHANADEEVVSVEDVKIENEVHTMMKSMMFQPSLKYPTYWSVSSSIYLVSSTFDDGR